MENVIVYCIEAPEGNFLKEITYHSTGTRYIFTSCFNDEAMRFGLKNQAEKFKKDNNLTWLKVTEHILMYNYGN